MRATDATSGKLVHWDGLNFSRSWMCSRIASRLDAGTRLQKELETCAAAHLELAVHALDDMHYAGSHWLCTFAIYALA